MTRIKLAHWYGDRAPGDELDVDAATLKEMRRDGRVAEVVAATQEQPAGTQPSEEPPKQVPTGRKRP